jgi:hypothetical protein
MISDTIAIKTTRTNAPIQARPEKSNRKFIFEHPPALLPQDDIQREYDTAEEGDYYPQEKINPEVFGDLALVPIDGQRWNENRNNYL